MLYNELNTTSKKTRKRVGRGNGSGLGTYSGRGMNGQSSRSGGKRKAGFEGGQSSFLRKMPKLGGFTNINRKDYFPVNIDLISKLYKEGETVNIETLIEKRVIKKAQLVKILGKGEISFPLTIEAVNISESAKAKLTKAKCTIK
jgi:large subunit ribosomal protein L15